MQTDPVEYEDGMNWYNYAGSDPINMLDPTGLGSVGTKGEEFNFTPPHLLEWGYGPDSDVGSFQNAGLLFGDHDYSAGPNLICPASWGCSAALVGSVYSQINNVIPGNTSTRPVVSGNVYKVNFRGLPMGFVKSYIGSDGLTVINITTSMHVFAQGWVNINSFQKNGNWHLLMELVRIII